MNSDSVNVPEYLLKCRSVLWNRKYDEKNFLYCVIGHLWPETANIRQCEKIPKEYESKFNLQGLTFPLQFSQISKFVRINKHLPLRIRVLFEGEHQLSVLDVFSNRSGEKNKNKNTLNLLMIKSDRQISSANKDSIDVNGISNVKDLEHQHHFFIIANLNGFLNNRKSAMTKGRRHRSQFYFCDSCLRDFRSRKKQKLHEKICQMDKQAVIYPEKGSVLNFDKQRNAFKAPVVGFADFECFMEKSEQEAKTCKTCGKAWVTCECQVSGCAELSKHRACGYSICFVDSENEVFYQETYSGKDAVENFLSKLDYFEELVEARKQRFKNTSQIIASKHDWEEYRAATLCHICKKDFDSGSRLYKKVVDHDHVTGNIVQAAHSICNLQRQGPFRTPIYFHNAKG